MTGLRYISIISVGSMVYIIIMLIAEFPGYTNDFWSRPGANINYFDFKFAYFNAVGVIYFAFTN